MTELVFDGYTNGNTKDFVDGLVSTGDMGHVEDGLYFVDGRDDDMIVSGGENVYPAEVESLLVQHPAVQEVSVVGVPDPEFGQRLAAFVVVREGESLEADEVRELVEAPGDARVTDLHVWKVGPEAHAAIVSVAGVRNGELVRQRLAPVHELAHLTVEVR